MTPADGTSALDQVPNIDAAIVEKVMLGGDLSQLTPAQRVSYYAATCKSLGLNPLTRPFDYLNLQGKTVLYARRECTEQLRSNRNVSVTITAREIIGDGVYVVSARATLPSGRTDESTGAVSIAGLKGEALCNSYLKAETKAKRRVTLSICGLGMIDESEVASVPEARRLNVDHETGEIVDGEVAAPVEHAPFVRPSSGPVTAPVSVPFQQTGQASLNDDSPFLDPNQDPDQDPDTPEPPPAGGEPCSQVQFQTFKSMAAAAGWGNTRLKAFLGTVLNADKFGDLSGVQASWAIEWVKTHPVDANGSDPS